MTDALLQKENQLKDSKTSHTISLLQNEEEQTDCDFSAMTCIQQAKYVESKLEDTCNKLSSATSILMNNSKVLSTSVLGTPNGKENVNNAMSVNFATPYTTSKKISSSTIKSLALPGTPAARPFNWLVNQAASEVKMLRQRAEKLHLIQSEHGAGDKTSCGDAEEANKENVMHDMNSEVLKGDNVHVSKYIEVVEDYKRQLREALAVINEQDRLIHAGAIYYWVLLSRIVQYSIV